MNEENHEYLAAARPGFTCPLVIHHKFRLVESILVGVIVDTIASYITMPDLNLIECMLIEHVVEVRAGREQTGLGRRVGYLLRGTIRIEHGEQVRLELGDRITVGLENDCHLALLAQNRDAYEYVYGDKEKDELQRLPLPFQH